MVKNLPANAKDTGLIPGLGRSVCNNYWSPCTRELLLLVRNHCDEQPLHHDWRAAPGGLQSMGSLRVRHDWETSLSLFTLMHWRRKWHPTPVFLHGESQGLRRLVGCSPWGRWELDTTEWLPFRFSPSCIGEGNGNPLQCSCMENPRDGGTWWAAVYGVSQSWARLKWLSSSSIVTKGKFLSPSQFIKLSHMPYHLTPTTT